jgi:predicted secreted protein
VVILKKIVTIFAIFICFAMVSGSFASTYSTKNTNKDLTGLTSNGHYLTVILPSNPSTGYHWVAEYNHSKVKLVSNIYIPTKPIICGSGGVNIFRFYGEKNSLINMKYVSPSGKVVKTHKYIIK